MRVVLDVGTTVNLLSPAALGQSRAVPIDSVMIGTSVQRGAVFNPKGSPFAPGVLGLVGTPLLSRYDLVFDGPHHVVRLYAHPKSPTVGSPSWFPVDVTRNDCVAMTADPQGRSRIFFPLEVSGHDIHSMFDSGSGTTNINMAAARVLGLSPDDSSMRLLPPGIGGQFSRFNGQKIWRAPHVTISVGHERIVTPMNVYQDLPRESSPSDPELSLGLQAVSDRVLYVSYSTQTVCVGQKQRMAPIAATTDRVLEIPISAERLAQYLAVKTALLAYWQSPANAALLQSAQAGGRTRLVPLNEYKLTTSVFDYPRLVKQDPTLAAIFKMNKFSASDFEPTQVSLFNAAATLTFDKAMGIPLPGPGTALGRNVALVSAHLQELKAVGLGFPSAQDRADSTGDKPLSDDELMRYIAVKQALGPYWQSHSTLLQSAQSTGHNRMVELPVGHFEVGVFDYPELVKQDTALAAIFVRNDFDPDQFEPTQLAAYSALGILAYDEANGTVLPAESTPLGKNVALVKAHRHELAAVGVTVDASR